MSWSSFCSRSNVEEIEPNFDKLQRNNFQIFKFSNFQISVYSFTNFLITAF
jgi:hypothetical protein